MKLIFFLSSNLRFCCCSLASCFFLQLLHRATAPGELLSLCTDSPAPLSPQV